MNYLYFGNKTLLLPEYRSRYTGIAESKLHIEKLREYFSDKSKIGVSDLEDFYRSKDPNVSYSAINWRIRTLVDKTVLQRIGHGQYTLGSQDIFKPTPDKFQSRLFVEIKKEFPYSELCIWNTSIFNEFMIHQPFLFYTIVETEDVSKTSIFYHIQNRGESVFFSDDVNMIDRYSNSKNKIVIVKALVTEAPVQQVDDIDTLTLEKALVDLICDVDLFSAYQGNERNTIFKEAFNKYTINQSKLLRYAGRRGKRLELKEYLGKLQLLAVKPN